MGIKYGTITCPGEFDIWHRAWKPDQARGVQEKTCLKVLLIITQVNVDAEKLNIYIWIK